MNNASYTMKSWTLMLASLLLFASCGLFKKGKHSSKKKETPQVVTSVDTVQPVPAPPTPVPTPAPRFSKEFADKYTPVWKSEINFQSFSGKAKCHFEGRGQNQDFTAHIRVKKNEAIWINVSALGGIVNVARLYATTDSFKLINFLERTYTSMKIEEANKVLPFPVDFSMLQNLLIGNPLTQDGVLQDIVEESGMVNLIIKKEQLNQVLAVNKQSGILQGLKVFSDNDNSVAAEQFDNYQTITNISFSKDRVITAVNQGYPYLLEMKFSDATFNGAVDMPFSVPKSYEKK